jgi:predicted nucleic acid-binding protein
MDFVLDASLMLAWLLPDEATSATEALLQSWEQGADLYAPPLLRYEVSNALVMAHLRRKRLTRKQAEEKLVEFEAFSVEYDADSSRLAPSKTSELALQHNLTVYDAAYLELALRLRLPLATLDGQLRAAAATTGITAL